MVPQPYWPEVSSLIVCRGPSHHRFGRTSDLSGMAKSPRQGFLSCRGDGWKPANRQTCHAPPRPSPPVQHRCRNRLGNLVTCNGRIIAGGSKKSRREMGGGSLAVGIPRFRFSFLSLAAPAAPYPLSRVVTILLLDTQLAARPTASGLPPIVR